MKLSLILLLAASGCNAFQPSVKTQTSRKSQSALTSDYVAAYVDTAIIDQPFPFPTSIEVPTLPQIHSKERVELFGEALGTFWIVGIGSIASMSATFVNPFMTLPQIAMVWSAAVTSAILITEPLSGAHLNPAFTIAQAVFRKFDRRKVLPYIGAQVFGSMAGSAASYGFFKHAIRGFEQAEGLVRASSIDTARVFGEYFDPSLVTATQAFGVEAMGTAILAATVFAVTHRRNSGRDIPVPFVVGGTVFSLINVLAPLTQCGMNPARDFGPRIVAFLAGWTDVAFQDCWLYIAGPIIGALAGAAFVDKVLYADKKEAKVVDAAWL
jgi:glycerol uptake facilitator protein